MDPITRGEMFLATAAGEYSGDLPDPVTREELYLAKLSGMNVDVPTPITRGDYYLNKACERMESLPSEPTEPTSNKFAQLVDRSITEVAAEDLAGATSIGEGAFNGCSSLTSITIPDSVTSIGNVAFSTCLSLTSITIPSSVTSIGYAAFYACLSLTSITIPSSVTSIDETVFGNCGSLTSIIMQPTTPPTIYNDTFPKNSGMSIIVPKGTGDLYKTTGNWTWYADYIVEAEE